MQWSTLSGFMQELSLMVIDEEKTKVVCLVWFVCFGFVFLCFCFSVGFWCLVLCCFGLLCGDDL